MTQSLSTMLHVELEVLRKHANFADCFSKMVGDTHVHLAALYSRNSRGAHRLEVSKFWLTLAMQFQWLFLPWDLRARIRSVWKRSTRVLHVLVFFGFDHSESTGTTTEKTDKHHVGTRCWRGSNHETLPPFNCLLLPTLSQHSLKWNHGGGFNLSNPFWCLAGALFFQNMARNH
jgi:hypothetical protein